MGFVMATFYLVNWPDDDIRQISLEVSLGETGGLGGDQNLQRSPPCTDLDKKCTLGSLTLGKCATSSPITG